MSTALYFPGTRSVADLHRLEVAQILSAVEALHAEGVIDTHEYRAKRSALTAGSRVLGQRTARH
jgi:hypothetical protein